MTALLIVGAAWTLLAVPAALLIGRGIRLADHRDAVATLTTIPDYVLRADAAESAGSQRGRS
jgi:hypothetical protein